MPAAVIGGAIAAVGAVGSSVIASKGASNAAKATTQAADNSTAVQQQMYNQSASALRPYQQAGLPATNAINALLGLNEGTQGNQAFAPQMVPEYGIGNELMGGSLPGPVSGFAGGSWNIDGTRATRDDGSPYYGQNPAQSYGSAFNNFRNSTGYQFRLGEGMRAINSGYAGAGMIKSGAAMKAINDYGQGMASQEFGNYLNALGNQQSLGFSAASAQAGVGQNYANSLSNIYQNQGSNLANAALVKSQNTANAIGGLANMGGYLAGRYG